MKTLQQALKEKQHQHQQSRAAQLMQIIARQTAAEEHAAKMERIHRRNKRSSRKAKAAAARELLEITRRQ